MQSTIKTQRVYEKSGVADGARYLVDRLWPRGLKKNSLKIEGWVKDIAPSAALRRWFNHDPDKWDEFRRRYFSELDSKPEVCAVLLEAAQGGPITLLYGARDPEHNNAVALSEYLKARSHRKTPKRPGG